MRKKVLALLCCLLLAPSVLAQDATPTTPPPIVLTVWIPDTLYNPQDQASAAILEEQFENFRRTHSALVLDIRLKKAEGNGGLLNTLLAGQAVAPRAMPDLILIRRSDLERAVQNGAIKPIDTWLPDTMRENLLPTVLELGTFNQTLYGLPYAISLSHLAYHTEHFEAVPTTFEDVLAGEQRFLLPGLPRTDQQVNDVVLAQYLEAGGRLADDQGNPVLDEAALLTVLGFYEQGLEQEIFGTDIITYDAASDYWSRFMQGDAGMAVVNSTIFLQQNENPDDIQATTIPSSQAEGLLVTDCWMWALVTTDLTQQDTALEFVEWLMRPDQQAEYTEAFGILPSQRTALRIWQNEAYTARVLDWIDQSLILPLEGRNNSAAQQLQAAFIAVINGTSAADAASTAITNLAD